MGSGWENPGPARQVVIAGSKGLLLVYSPSPGPNKLILSIAGSGGFDKYNNSYTAGLEIHGAIPIISFNPLGSTGTAGAIQVEPVNDGGLRYEMQLIPPQDALGGSEAAIFLRSNKVMTIISQILNVDPTFGTGRVGIGENVASHIELIALVQLALGYGNAGSTSTGVKIGHGQTPYKCYYEEVLLSAQVIASSAAASTLVNLTTTQLENDWAAGGISAWNFSTGIWTCPADGRYAWTASMQYTNWVAGSRFILFGARNGTTNTNAFMTFDNQALGGNNGKGTISAVKQFAAGDTVRIRAGQVTGANQTIDSVATPEINYISTKLLV